MFHGLQFHLVGKGSLAGEKAFPLQVAVNHNNRGGVIVQIPDNHRHSRTPLFTNHGNKPLTRAGVTYILKKYAEQAQAAGVKDISDEITPHWLRHSKALHLLQSGINLVYIRDLLGHSNISTTEIYARADEKMKRKALMEAYNSPSSDKLPEWKKDKDLLDWLKSL